MASNNARSNDPSTLKGYDMVISITQDAINKQFQRLYETPIPTALMPDPEEIEGYATLPPAKHYINHSIKILPKLRVAWDDPDFEDVRPAVRPADGFIWVDNDSWVEGDIEAPYVTFGEEENNYRCVRVHLKFSKGSVYYFLGSKPKKYSLDGCTLSWLAELAHDKVGDALSDVIAASQSAEDSTLLAPAVLEKFKAIDDQFYTVTALFCLFNSTKIVDSFRLLDAQGNEMMGDNKTTYTKLKISEYFAALSKQSIVASTPNNPFVLGYALTQKVDPKTAAQVLRAENVPYMVPKAFDMTVTKGDGIFSKGVLNYCILTHRAAGVAPSMVDIKKDPSAGFWAAGDTAFNRIRSDGLSSGADGIMALSRGIFRDFWLKEQVLDYFKVDTKNTAKALVPPDDKVASPPDVRIDVTSVTLGTDSDLNSLALEQVFNYAPMPCQDMDFETMQKTENLSPQMLALLSLLKHMNAEMKYKQQRLAQGLATAKLTYTSDLQKNPSIGKGSDVHRRLYFDVQLKSLVTITQEASGICNVNMLGGHAGEAVEDVAKFSFKNSQEQQAIVRKWVERFSQWRMARRAVVQIRAQAGLDMNPAADTWKLDFVKTPPRTTVPQDGKHFTPDIIGPVDYTLLENIQAIDKEPKHTPRTTDGVTVELSNHAMFREYGTMKGMTEFARPAGQWANIFDVEMQRKMEALSRSLATKLILPAGNVFEFKSLNTDDAGHVYSLLTYKTSTDVSQVNTTA